MKQQQGFTLIELIVVIVILGILAATALPKFSDLSAEARLAKVKAMSAAMKSGAAMARGMQLAQGAASNAPVTVEGGTAVVMVNGYPSASAVGIGATIDLTDYSNLLDTSGAVAADTLYPLCNVTYTPATTAGLPPVYTVPITSANCR